MHVILGYSWHDHADRNELNNRKYNLRPATNQENARNHSKQKNNTSGFTGVFQDKKTCKWRSFVEISKNRINLGSYKEKEDAIRARLRTEAKYYGEFAPQRHLFKEYGITDDFLEET